MKIMHLSDLHNRQRWFKWAADQARYFDAVCISGDFLAMLPSADVSLPQQVKWVSEWLAAFPGLLLCCSGNHDWWNGPRDDRDADAKWLRRARRRGMVVDGEVKIIGGRRFVCTPWLQSPEASGDEPVVLLAHAPPEGSAVSRSRGESDHGDFELAQLAEELPRGSFVLSGHVHQPAQFFARIGHTYCFNPGVNFEIRAVPNHIIIDTERRIAEYRVDGLLPERIKLRD
jgi:Icc-related predicted phosphoesterase